MNCCSGASAIFLISVFLILLSNWYSVFFKFFFCLQCYESLDQSVVIGSSVRVAKVELDTAEGKVSDVDIEHVNGVGGHLLDDRFLVLLRNIFGSHIIQAFEDYLPVAMLDFMRNFELTKSNMAPEFSKKYVFYLHAALIKKYKFLVPSFRGKDAFSPNPRYGDKVTMTDHNLVADETIVWFFLKEAVEKVIEFLQSAFEKLQIDSNTAIIVTGGYSQYWKLRDVMRQKFSKRHVVYMDSPAETALIGALMVLKEIEAKKTFESNLYTTEIIISQ